MRAYRSAGGGPHPLRLGRGWATRGWAGASGAVQGRTRRGLRLPAGISLSHPAGIQHSKQQQQHSQVVDIADSPKKKVSMELSERQIAALRSLGML